MRPFIKKVHVHRIDFETPQQVVSYFQQCFNSAYNSHSPSDAEFQYIRKILKQHFNLKSITCNGYGQLKTIKLENGDIMSALSAFETALTSVEID